MFCSGSHCQYPKHLGFFVGILLAQRKLKPVTENSFIRHYCKSRFDCSGRKPLNSDSAAWIITMMMSASSLLNTSLESLELPPSNFERKYVPRFSNLPHAFNGSSEQLPLP